MPANLQGLWNEYILPPWSSNYTTNINVEENYWPAEITGLGELHATALLPWIKNLSASGKRTARNYYGVDRGWCLAHNSDIWAMTNPVGLTDGDPTWANWNMVAHGSQAISGNIISSARTRSFWLSTIRLLRELPSSASDGSLKKTES